MSDQILSIRCDQKQPETLFKYKVYVSKTDMHQAVWRCSGNSSQFFIEFIILNAYP